MQKTDTNDILESILKPIKLHEEHRVYRLMAVKFRGVSLKELGIRWTISYIFYGNKR